MKIVFYRHSLLSRGGDKMIIAHAAGLVECGHTVIIQTSIIDTVFEIHPGIIIKKNNVSSKAGTIWLALTKRISADIVVGDIVVMCVVLAFRNKKKVVYFAQDYDESYYTYKIQQFFIRIIYYLGLCLFKIPVIAVSNELSGILNKRFKITADVIVNGVDLKQFYHEPSNELIKKSENIAILLLSRKDFRKGFDIGIKTIKEFQKKHSIPFEVWTVGDKPHNTFPGINLQHFGYVNENRLREMMNGADVFLYPSRHEGFPLMVMEAFACKCPVVTTEAVSYAIHEKTALKSKIEDFCNLSDNLYRIISDKKLKERLVQDGFRFAEKNSLKNSSINFEKMLKKVYGKI